MAVVPNYGFLPQPDQLQFTQWASVAVEQLSDYGLPQPPNDDAMWQTWATNFCNGSMPGTQAPDPQGFSSWADWAHALIGTLA